MRSARDPIPCRSPLNTYESNRTPLFVRTDHKGDPQAQALLQHILSTNSPMHPDNKRGPQRKRHRVTRSLNSTAVHRANETLQTSRPTLSIPPQPAIPNVILNDLSTPPARAGTS